MNPLKLVAFDMDGTFMHDDHTYDTERFKRIFERGREQDVRFAAASGNQYWLMRDRFIDTYKQMGFVADNGACVWVGDELISCSTMSRDTALLALDAISSIASDDVWCIADGIESSWIPSGQPQEFFDFMSNFNLHLAWTDDVFAVDDEFLKCALILPEDKVVENIEYLSKVFAGKLLPIKAARNCIDIIQPGVNKASGLETLAAYWNISSQECVCFGDSGNDLEMLSWAGMAIAMGNADENVKMAANMVCPSNEDDGVLSTIENLLA